LNTLNSSLFFLLLLFGLKENILGGTREKIPRDSDGKKNSEPREKEEEKL
jgi:hypothetical protein